MKNRKDEFDDLRKKAEDKLSELPGGEELSEEEMRRAVHELRVHQIELEMQNDALREAQAELLESHSNYADLYDFAPVGYLTLDEKSLILEANLTLSKLTGIERGNLLGQPFSSYIAPKDRGEFLTFLARIFETRERASLEMELVVRSSGNRFPAQLEGLFVEDALHRKRCRISVTDISKRKKAEETTSLYLNQLEQSNRALETANEQLRRLPSLLIAAQEKERKRLASELHDSIGQTLAALKFRIEMVLDAFKMRKAKEAVRLAEDFVPILQRSIEETRAICVGLRPQVLEDFGLIAALRWYRDEMIRLYPQRHIELDIAIQGEQIPGDLSVPIFRIVQEALNNVNKHSGAEWVDISIAMNEGIELKVSDDGRGMELDFILHSDNGRNLGIIGMRERAELTGGKFTIESTPGQGTTVRAKWPVA